jgi:ferritin-like metal-binding protein YciE
MLRRSLSTHGNTLDNDEEGPSFDSGLIGAALRTEHYEIAGYEACISMSETLGMKDVSSLLNESLKEERSAAKKIKDAGKPILKAASQQQGESAKKVKTGKERYSATKSKEDERDAARNLKRR